MSSKSSAQTSRKSWLQHCIGSSQSFWNYVSDLLAVVPQGGADCSGFLTFESSLISCLQSRLKEAASLLLVCFDLPFVFMAFCVDFALSWTLLIAGACFIFNVSNLKTEPKQWISVWFGSVGQPTKNQMDDDVNKPIGFGSDRVFPKTEPNQTGLQTPLCYKSSFNLIYSYYSSPKKQKMLMWHNSCHIYVYIMSTPFMPRHYFSLVVWPTGDNRLN